MKKLTFLLLVLNSIICYSQHQPNLTQYVENQFIFNPAYAGTQGYASFNFSAREQWVGINDAPKTTTFSAQTRLLKSGKKIVNPMKWVSKDAKDKIMIIPKSKGRVGLGAYVFDERSGLISRTGMNITYAYHITMPTVQYSFGLAFTGYQLKLNTNDAFTINVNDPMLDESRNQMFIPDANIGFYMLARKYYLGLSANQLMQSALKMGEASNIDYRYRRHYNINAGYYYYTNDWMIEPSVLIKFSEEGLLQNDIVLTANYTEKYIMGLGYRMNLYNPYNDPSFDDLSIDSHGDLLILMGINIKSFFVGYSFDLPFSATAKGNYGTHEISATIKLGSSDRRFKWKERY